jgi:4-alpha-glucanotransferase
VAPGSDRVDFGAMIAFKGPRLAQAADRLMNDSGHPLHDELAAFTAANAGWLDDAVLFRVIKDANGQKPWWQWPAGLRDATPKALAKARKTLRTEIDRATAIQFFFDRQWQRVHDACRARGVALIGDLPIYVDADSADVWAHKRLFQLDGEGARTEVAGVPPDAFSETGQLWGNPLYRWDTLAEEGFAWWVDRMRRVLSTTDRVRIDHFRAFANYWAVPAEAEDARAGEWREGPGKAFFDALGAQLGALPILAEDLGLIDQPVRDLLADVGLPGMKVLQFAFGGGNDNHYLPHNHVPNSVVYTGTHDNDTTLGWWDAAPEHVRSHLQRYFGVSGDDLVWDLIRAALSSVAHTAIMPLQDVLTLNATARMNTPAVAEGNWGWRAPAEAFDRWDLAQRVRDLSALYERI